MNPIKLLCCAALALAVVSAQSTTTAPSTNSTTAEITVTKDQLDAIIKEVKDAAGKDPEFAALLESIDLDALLKLTPEQVRKVLNDKLFGTIDSSSSGSGTGTKNTVTTAPPSTDAISTKSPSVPAPGGSSAASSVATASITTLAAGVVVTVLYL